ncbi:MAG: hypothetical protein Q7U76_12710 [Nitrospirota bacterium]|nr:hypothetical protein [Nitrospirota bacterium]
MTQQEHLLTCLIEESSEVIKATSKALRFGIHGYSHAWDSTGKFNREQIRAELHDLMGVIEMLHDEVLYILPFDRSLIEAKKIKVLKYIQHARTNGSIT